MASSAPQPPSSERSVLDALTVRAAHGDLLDVQPLDLGSDSPATRALQLERAEASAPSPDT